MRVLAYDPFAPPPAEVACADLDELVAASDVLTLHVPLTAENHHLVDAAFLARTKPGAVLVNCGRGGLLDLDAALAALESGQLAGVGLDVFEPEPPAHHPIFDHPSVSLTPHLMGLTRKATAATFADAAQGVVDVLSGRRPAAVANPDLEPSEGGCDMTSFRIAGAPISWGVCEVPGWGYQLGPDQVLAEMREVGLLATELGPDGFLPAAPDAMATVLAQHGLQAVGGFTPLLLHVPGHDPVPEVERILEGYVAAERRDPGAVRRSAARTATTAAPSSTTTGWQTLLDNLSRISQVAAAAGNPRRPAPARRHDDREHRRGAAGAGGLVDRAVPGHRAPADRRHRPRRAHPPGRPTASRTCTSRTSTPARPSTSRTAAGPTPRASVEGMYRPLGTGDVDVAAIVEHLTQARLRRLVHPRAGHHPRPSSRRGEGPVGDVRTSADNLRAVLRSTRDGCSRRTSRCGSGSSARRASPSWASSSPRTPPGPGSSPWRPGTGGAPRRSPPSTASSG